MKRLWLLLLFLPTLAWSAASVSTITGAAVNASGWWLDVWFTNDTYTADTITNSSWPFYTGWWTTNYLYGTNGYLVPTATVGTFSLTSMGYTPTAALTTRTRTGWLSREMRYPFGGGGQDALNYIPDLAVENGLVHVKAVLTSFVFSRDSNAVVTFPANWVSNSTAISFTATNNSAIGYGVAQPIVSFSWPGWNQVGRTMRVNAVGFHQYGMNRQPLACMQFVATGQNGGEIITNTETAMRFDTTHPDAVPFAEYYTDFDLGAFNNANLVRVDVVAVPWIGDTNAVYDSRSNYNAQVTPFMGTAITNFYNTNTYSVIAVVDQTSGDNTLGRATNTTPQNVNTAHYFQTENAAWVAVKGTNNTMFSHNDCGGGVVYLKSTVSSNMVNSGTTSGATKVWATVANYPGDTVVLDTTSGNQTICGRDKMQGLTFAYVGTAQPYLGATMFWADQCVFNTTGSGPFSVNNTNMICTDSTVTTYTQGFKPSTGSGWGLLRGINLGSFNAEMDWWTVLGNLSTNSLKTSFVMLGDQLSASVGAPDRQIFYNNIILGMTNNTMIRVGSNRGVTNGMAIVQNIVEGTLTNASYEILGTANVSTNVIWQYNTDSGYRHQWFYSPTPGSILNGRTLCSAKHGLFAIAVGEMTDISGTGDAARIGDWSCRYRVDCFGNMYAQVSSEATDTDRACMFRGPGTFRPTPDGHTTPGWVKFMDPRGEGFHAAPLGGGNYRLQTSSPVTSPYLSYGDVSLPYDIDGVPRGGWDPPGGYVSASSRKGAHFFGQ